MEASDIAVSSAFASQPAPAAEDTVRVRVTGPHPFTAFDPSEEGVPVITDAAHGVQIPAGQADALIVKALEHGVTVEKVGD